MLRAEKKLSLNTRGEGGRRAKVWIMVREVARKRFRLTPLTTRAHDLVVDGGMDEMAGNAPLFSVFTRGAPSCRRRRTSICVVNVGNQHSQRRRHAYTDDRTLDRRDNIESGESREGMILLFKTSPSLSPLSPCAEPSLLCFPAQRR